MLPTEMRSNLQTGVSHSALTDYCRDLRAQGALVLLSDQTVDIVFSATTQTYTVLHVGDDLWRLVENGAAEAPEPPQQSEGERSPTKT